MSNRVCAASAASAVPMPTTTLFNKSVTSDVSFDIGGPGSLVVNSTYGKRKISAPIMVLTYIRRSSHVLGRGLGGLRITPIRALPGSCGQHPTFLAIPHTYQSLSRASEPLSRPKRPCALLYHVFAQLRL